MCWFTIYESTSIRISTWDRKKRNLDIHFWTKFPIIPLLSRQWHWTDVHWLLVLYSGSPGCGHETRSSDCPSYCVSCFYSILYNLAHGFINYLLYGLLLYNSITLDSSIEIEQVIPWYLVLMLQSLQNIFRQRKYLMCKLRFSLVYKRLHVAQHTSYNINGNWIEDLHFTNFLFKIV